MPDHLNEKPQKNKDIPPEAGDGGRQTEKKGLIAGIRANSFLMGLLSWIEVLVIAVAIAFITNTFLIANSTVPTGSMENTIMAGDRVIGSRIRYYNHAPERGDVAIFKFGWICRSCKVARGENPAPEICPHCGAEMKHPKTLYYVKRVIGVPGDVIDIRKGAEVSASEFDDVEELVGALPKSDMKLVTADVYVNGEKLFEPYLKEPMLYTGDMHFEVPENCYFFMGDNRNYSLDARFWNNSYIERDRIIARVMFRYFPKPSKIK